ncbi:MAG: choice-of-anchor D domain-containing protein, partial [Acidimicrobiales bacterium]
MGRPPTTARVAGPTVLMRRALAAVTAMVLAAVPVLVQASPAQAATAGPVDLPQGSQGAGGTGTELAASPAQAGFGTVRVGEIGGPTDVTLSNTSTVDDTISGLTIGGDSDDFVARTDCGVLAPGQSCTAQVFFLPGAFGARQAALTVEDGSPVPPVIELSGVGTEGYFEASAAGAVCPFGDAQGQGDMSHAHLQQPIVGMASTPDGGGYWMVASDGGIFAFGDASFFGSIGAMHLDKPIVGMASTPDGGGYWLVASDGGIFSFGDASFFGSTGAVHLDKPIVGMAPTPDGGGYWL